MRKTTPARRKGAVKVILFGVLAAAVILLAGALGRRSADTAIRAGTNEERIAYLQSLGWEVEPTPILEQEITMPKDFPDVLTQYNELQRQQGDSRGPGDADRQARASLYRVHASAPFLRIRTESSALRFPRRTPTAVSAAPASAA